MSNGEKKEKIHNVCPPENLALCLLKGLCVAEKIC